MLTPPHSTTQGRRGETPSHYLTNFIPTTVDRTHDGSRKGKRREGRMSLHFLAFPEKQRGTGLVLLQPRNFLTANILYPLHPPLLVFRLSLPRSRFLPPPSSLQEPEKQKLPPPFPFFSVRPSFGLSREGENNETKEGGGKKGAAMEGRPSSSSSSFAPLSLSIRLEVLCASANNSPPPPVAKAFPCSAPPSLRKGRDGGLLPSFPFVPPSFRYPKTTAAL